MATAPLWDKDWQTQGVRRPAQNQNNIAPGARTSSILTNFFKIQQLPKGKWYQYDEFYYPGDMEKTVPHAKRKASMHRLQVEKAPHIFTGQGLYDTQNSFYTLVNMGPGHLFDDIWSRDGQPSKTPLSIRFTHVVDADAGALQPFYEGTHNIERAGNMIVQVLNLALRADASQSPHVTVSRRAIYELPSAPVRGADLEGGLQALRGFFQSVRPGIGRMYVNVDTATGVSIKPILLIEFCLDWIRLHARNVEERFIANNMTATDHSKIKGLTRILKNVKFETRHTKSKNQPTPRVRRYTFFKFSPLSASNFMFEDPPRSIQQYFETAYRIRLRFSKAPCALASGSDEAAYPLEVCHILPGQMVDKGTKLAPQQMSKILGLAQRKPAQRLQSIQDAMRTGGLLNYQNGAFLASHGINIALDACAIDAQVLPPSRVQYNLARRPLEIRDGKWNVANETLLEPGNVRFVCVAVFAPVTGERERNAVVRFLKELISTCRGRGMGFPDFEDMLIEELPPDPPQVPMLLTRLMERTLLKMQKRGTWRGPPPQDNFPTASTSLVICLLADGSTDLKIAIKRWGDLEKGIPTQVVVADKALRKEGGQLNQYCNNLTLKVNSKVGGVNCAVPEGGLPWNSVQHLTLIMGADVSHGAPRSGMPSMAALVSTIDPWGRRHVAETTIQDRGVEIIENLERMVHNAITQYIAYNKPAFNGQMPPPPKRILFFRDGVSEGQFGQIFEHEIRAIRAACATHKFLPEITFIVVGKNHHMRMFPNEARGYAGDRTGNCQSGTVVDSQVANPIWLDYWLLSHQGLLGTSRPSHYSVLLNDTGFSQLQLQQICFALCHNYARATRTVSIPSIVFYADLACARLPYQLPEVNLDTLSEENTSIDWFLARFKPVHPLIGRNMYWM